MVFFNKLFKKEKSAKYKDSDIVSVAEGTFCAASEISDPVFAGEMLGQTVAFKLKNGSIVSPANGVLEVLYPTGHAFAVKMKDGTGLLVHIGINTVDMNGKGFNTLVKQGDTVKAGQPIVEVDLDAVKEAGYDSITMLIVAESVSDEKINYIECGEVQKGQIIINS